MRSDYFRPIFSVIAMLFSLQNLSAEVTGAWDGGPPPTPTQDCVSAEQRAQMNLLTNGIPPTISTFVGAVIPPRTQVLPTGSAFRVSWPTSAAPYVLEFNTNFSASVWQQVSNGITQASGQNVVTNPGNGSPRFFRLRLQL